MSPQIVCRGVRVNSLTVPSFELEPGKQLCLNLPCHSGDVDENLLIQMLIARVPNEAVQVTGRVVRIVPPDARGWFGPFGLPRVAKWFSRAANVSNATARLVASQLELDPSVEIARLGWSTRILLALEAAWAIGADAIIYDTVGLGPIGEAQVFDAVATHLDRVPAIFLSHEYMEAGVPGRSCPPGAISVDVGTTSRSRPLARPGLIDKFQNVRE